MGFITNFKAGRAMTKMVNLMEEIESNRKTSDEGYGSYLPEARQIQIEIEFLENMNYLRRFPRHVVTENLLKNMRIASRFDNKKRIQASSNILEILIEEGIALDLDTFEKSYLR